MKIRVEGARPVMMNQLSLKEVGIFRNLFPRVWIDRAPRDNVTELVCLFL